MPDFYDRMNDTRWLARRTADAQQEAHRVTKAVQSVAQAAMLPVAKQANVRRVACYTPTGSFVGLVQPARLLAPYTVAKAAAAGLIAVFDDKGKLLGAVDPKAVEGLGKGESFSFDENGNLAGIIGSDGVIRPVRAPASEEVSTAMQAERDAAATLAAWAPAEPGGVAPAPIVSPATKARRPAPTWEEATAALLKVRGTLARMRERRVLKSMDTRDLRALEDAERCLELLEPVLKRSAPPQPDATRILKRLGEAVIRQSVRKSGQPINLDPMVAAALAYSALPPDSQRAIKQQLARTSMESRQRAKRELSAATERELSSAGTVRKSMFDPNELRIVARERRTE